MSNAGEALLLGRRDQDAVVRWLTPDGQEAVPDATDAGAGGLLASSFGFGPVRLYPLLDDSLALWTGSFWARRYEHLTGHGGPPPPWLPPSGRFRFTRGNRGYALMPAPDQVSSDCSQVVQIVAPDGRNCARITFHEEGAPDCKTGFLDQGWDGTVIRQAASGSCTWRVWPGFLAGP